MTTSGAMKCVRVLAAILRGIAIVGTVSAMFLVFFAVTGDKLQEAMVIAAWGLVWWIVCDGIAWLLRRKADEMRRDVESRPRELPAGPSWR